LSKESIYEELADSVLSFDPDIVVQASKKALEAKLNPTEIIANGLGKGLETVGKKFENGELFLMHLMAAADAVKKALSEVLEPELVKYKAEMKTLGKVVIGTVAGDIHEIGKNIVAAMLFAGGFEVHDLGKDVPVEEFMKKAKEVKANIIGASALLSTTLPVQHEIVKAFDAEGLRDKVKVMVGGAPVTEEWVREIGADGYAENGMEAVKVARKLLNIQS
jgi:corrinoid protein of di/trimethylamine methyltransferase